MFSCTRCLSSSLLIILKTSGSCTRMLSILIKTYFYVLCQKGVDFFYFPVHLPRYRLVGRVGKFACPQLYQMVAFPQVKLEKGPLAEGQGNDVLRLPGKFLANFFVSQ